MEIRINQQQQVQVVAIIGELDGATTPVAVEQITPLAQSGVRIILDMSQVNFMSSAGLRMMLLMYRLITGRGGKVALAGLSEDLADTMSMTGFLDFFSCFKSVDQAVAALKA